MSNFPSHHPVSFLRSLERAAGGAGCYIHNMNDRELLLARDAQKLGLVEQYADRLLLTRKGRAFLKDLSSGQPWRSFGDLSDLEFMSLAHNVKPKRAASYKKRRSY